MFIVNLVYLPLVLGQTYHSNQCRPDQMQRNVAFDQVETVCHQGLEGVLKHISRQYNELI